ncbi:MAG: DUF4254 domain-containing protein [Planctomycetota bacterium]
MWDKGNDWVQRVTEMHRETVARWHEVPVDNPYDGLLGIACQQHQFNFLLWHEEDVARSPNVSDQRIAEVKRQIDKYNQQRNDWIEKIDAAILEALTEEGVTPTETVPLNTETPGSATDRLSIMSLRIFHMDEQLQRDDADEAHKQGVQVKLARCHEQLADLSGALSQLWDDLAAGTKRLKLYRQMKMYNDPTLNPYLYSDKTT